MTDEQLESIVMDRFAGMLAEHIEESGGFCFGGNHVTEKSGYDLEADWRIQLMTAKSIREYPSKLKTLALEFLPTFLEEYPQYRGCQYLEGAE